MKISSFPFVRTWAMPHISYLSCGVPFPVWTRDNISGYISCPVAVEVRGHKKKIVGNILLREGGKFFFEVVFVFW